ncbi:MAG TPA: M23 family metallopeptidase [Acidimicrobiales bacterium]|nr:M23 family metallopeptidase [Acidimicrobiales bacterium]
MAGRLVNLALLVSLLTGCSGAASEAVIMQGTTTSTTTPTTTTSTSTTSTSTTTSTTVPPRPVTTTVVRPRPVTEQAYTPFATAGGVVLRHPAARVERIGFHESNLDGAQQLVTLPTAAPTLVLEGRTRDTAARGAADVMVDPDAEIRAPVTGTVRYAGTYVLYCKYSDDYLVIEPDDHPGWEVKMLHIDGVRVGPGARVQAGVTVVAPRATRLPFESQIEEGSYRPAWPHVHIEIDDPTVPDRPTGPGC